MLLKTKNVLGGMYLSFLLILLLTLTILACTPDCVHATTVNNTTINNDNITVDFNNTLLERQNTTTNTVTTEYNETYTNTSVDLGFKPLDITGGFNHESGSGNSKNTNVETHDFHEQNYRIANDKVATHYINKRTGIDIAKIDKEVRLKELDTNLEALKITKTNELEALKINVLEAKKLDIEYKKFIILEIFKRTNNLYEASQEAKKLGETLSQYYI